MSKPNPSITANLLTGLTLQPASDTRTSATSMAPKGERHPAPVTHKPKQAPIKSTASHTRTSNRGK